MSKSVVLSIRPEWTELIFKGEKTLELRRSRPRQDFPFKVYIYETRGDYPKHGHGQIIGEFICRHIKKDMNPSIGIVDADYERKSCVPAEQVIAYARVRKRNPQLVYWWEISDLVKYEKPIELKEVGVKHAPQSWSYCEDKKDV